MHFALGVRADAPDRWRRHLVASGVAVEHERGGHSVYGRDPAGSSVELVTPGVGGTPVEWYGY